MPARLLTRQLQGEPEIDLPQTRLASASSLRSVGERLWVQASLSRLPLTILSGCDSYTGYDLPTTRTHFLPLDAQSWHLVTV